MSVEDTISIVIKFYIVLALLLVFAIASLAFTAGALLF
jgi:hypothetical protein